MLIGLCSYNPEFGDWEFGKLSALREIALAQECDYRYYYMGSCNSQASPATSLWTSLLTKYQGTISTHVSRCDIRAATLPNIS